MSRDSDALDMIAELEDALIDMVAQHCVVWTSDDPKEMRYHHNFLSANEHAFDVLEKFGCIEPDGNAWKIVQKTKKEGG